MIALSFENSLHPGSLLWFPEYSGFSSPVPLSFPLNIQTSPSSVSMQTLVWMLGMYHLPSKLLPCKSHRALCLTHPVGLASFNLFLISFISNLEIVIHLIPSAFTELILQPIREGLELNIFRNFVLNSFGS